MARPRTAQILERLKRLSGYSDRSLGELAGCSRDKIERLRRGIQDMTIPDAEALASALDVDPSVWFMEPDDAVRHAIDQWGIERVVSQMPMNLIPTLCGRKVLVGANHAA